MSEWILNRWSRYGQDRLYAETSDGARLGYLDMKTYELHPTDPADLPQLSAAIAAYLNQAADPDGDTQTMYLPRRDFDDWTVPVTTPRPVAVPEPAERSSTPIHAALARLFGASSTEESGWALGADSEEGIAYQLASLGMGWTAIDDVPVGANGSNIDYLVIGPGGVFVIDINDRADASVWVDGDVFLVNGNPTHYIGNTRHEAAWTSALLSAQVGRPVEVKAILAVNDSNGGLTVKDQPRGGSVVVLPGRKVGSFLKNQRSALTFDEVDALCHLARRSTTWRPAIA